MRSARLRPCSGTRPWPLGSRLRELTFDRKEDLTHESDSGKGRRIGKADNIPARFPQVREVSAAGTFNDWDPARDSMKRKGNGPWVLIRHLPRGVHEYRFVVDGIWTSDPMNRSRCPNPFGGENCIIEI